MRIVIWHKQMKILVFVSAALEDRISNYFSKVFSYKSVLDNFGDMSIRILDELALFSVYLFF